MWFLCAVIVIAMVLFITEKVSIDVTSIFIAFTLMVTGLVTVPQGLSGFSNQAALAILALLILNTGLENTGVLRLLTNRLVGVTGKSPWAILLILLPFVAVLSAFTNNTAVIAMFLPVLLALGDRKGISPSKLLMPMAFMSILGGLCTIIGTSTNLLVNSIARQYGIAPFAFFEFSVIGVAMAAGGFIYLIVLGIGLVPARREPLDMDAADRKKRYLTEVVVRNGVKGMKALEEVRKAFARNGLELMRISTPKGRPMLFQERSVLQEGDKILLRGSPEHIARFQGDEQFMLTSDMGADRLRLNEQETHLVEAVVAPGSAFIDRRIKDLDLLGRLECVPLALRRGDDQDAGPLSEIRLHMGDVLLLEATERLAQDPEVGRDLILLETVPRVQSLRRRWTAVLIFAAAIATAAFDLVPITISALGGVLAMAVTRCIDLSATYKRVEWKVYFLIAGLIPLGIAIENTGLDDHMAEAFIRASQGFTPFAVVVTLYVATALITNVMANNATALLMAPIAVKIAVQLGIDPKALLLTIMFGASTSFFTPVGYHTLTLVYTPGHYRFKDYFRAGLPLTVIVGTIACLMIAWRYGIL
jgi:di/tricarboxylate transporter